MDTHVADSVGKYSGFAFLYLSGCLITAVLNSVFVADYRLLFPNILYTLRHNQLVSYNKWINVNYLAHFIHLFIYVMNGLVYAMILTIAILTGNGWKGSSLFFIGVVIFNVLNIFFMLYYNSWQPTICFPYYKTCIILGVLAFIIAQLTGLPGTPTYRAHGALYVALSAIPLLLVYTHHFDDTKKVKSSVESSLALEKQRNGTKGSMDNLYALLKDPHVLIPRQNLSLWMADQLYAKLVSLQKSIVGIPNPDGTLSLFFRNNFKVSLDFVVTWLVSYIPLVIFCFVMTSSIDTNASAAAIVLVVLFLNDLCLFSLRLKWSHLCCILVTYRFIAVLAGSYYWLLGIFVITLFTITVRALEILDSYVFKSKLSSNTISSILTSLTAKEKESIEHQKVVAAHLADDSTATRTPSPVADASIPPVKSGYITAITSYISLPIVTLHCILIVALIIAATTPNNLLVPRFSSATETEWAGLLWLAWATAMVMYCTHKIKNLPVNKDGSISIVERLEAALESQKEFKVVGTALANIDLDVKVTLNSSTGVPTAGSNVVADAAAGTAVGHSRSASAPDLGNHYTLLTAYLKLLSCLMLVATSVMAACIQRLWVIIPTITIIPISVFIWMKFMAKWGKDDNSFDKCLPFVSPCYNCAQSTWERPTFSSLGANMLSNPLFALVLLIVTCAICARMHYWYCVLYLCLWILAAALIHMAAMYWFSNVKLDYILLAIISASFIPTLIWALVAGLMQSSGIDKYGVIMLMMSATVFQLLVIIVVIYRDYLQMKASADATNNAKAKSFLYGLISLAFTCAVICASIFSVQVSAPLGIGFICLIVAVALYFHLQLSENNKTILSDVKVYLESVVARCGACISSNCPVIQRASQGAGGALSRLLPLSGDKYTNYLVITGLFVTLCGLYGAIADSDNAFWWSSLSWLSMATVFLLLGLQVEMLQYYDKLDRVYDTDVFVPVYCFDSSSNGKVSNVSFRSCGLIIFLAMLAAWGIWVSVIASPPDIGVVIYTISAVATLVYIKFGCGKTTLCINQLVATGGFTDELLLDCGNTSIKAFSGTTALLDPSNAAKEASDPAAVYTAIAEYAVQKQTALELLNKEVAAQCVSYLSPVPLVGALLAWQNGVVFDKLANETAVNAMHELYETFTDDFALLTEFYAYFRLTALSAARLHYRQHIAGLLAFIQSNSTLAVREKDLLNLNEVEMLAIMSGYNRYLKSKEAESEVSKKEEERIKEQQRRIEEERRRVLEAELTKRRQAEEEERKRREAEEAIRVAREKEEQRKRDELAAKGVQDEQHKLEEERKRVEEAKQRELEEQRKKHVKGDDDDVVVSTYGRPVQESVDAIFGKMANASTKYVDPDFSSTNVVLGDAKYTGKAKKDMKRLTELNSGMLREISPVGLPQAGVSSQDIKQGALGDCYFLSAIATVASKPKLIENIFPAALPDKGIYTVKLYHEGGFKTVVVDDYFPVDTNESLMFAHPDEWATKKLANSAWVMILEKGYAKLNGNYANIGEGGYEDVAMGVLTGGIPDRISDINKASDGQKTWEILKSLYNNGHLLGAGSHAGSDTTTSDLGIVQGHAYSILQVREVDEFKLMQLRNPWVSPTTSSFTHSPLTSLLTRATANGVVSGLTKILKVGRRESSRL